MQPGHIKGLWKTISMHLSDCLRYLSEALYYINVCNSLEQANRLAAICIIRSKEICSGEIQSFCVCLQETHFNPNSD